MAQLKRTLGLAECIFFGVGSILGAGIYTLIGKIAGWSGNFTWLAFLIASITALFTAFSYAELSAAFPKAGGEYVYVKKAFGNEIGIILGSIVAFNGIISGATVALGFAGYFTELIHINLIAASLGIIVLMFIINISGIKESSVVNIILTIVEISGLFFVIYAAFPSIGKVNYTELSSKGVNGILIGAVLAFFANIGFEKIVNLAEETKNPEKNIPTALFVSSVIVIIMYSIVAICAVSMISSEELSKSESPLAEVVGKRFERTGIVIIAVIALFSTSNTILSSMLASSRVLFNISKETKKFKWPSYVSPKYNTPVRALILIFFIMCSLALIGNIEIIARIATLFIFITFIIVNFSVIVLRVKEKKIVRPYRIPINIKNIPLISLLGIIMTLILLGYNITVLFKESIP